MKKVLPFIFALGTICFVQAQPNYKLWYKSPASASVKDLADGWTSDSAWLKALPVGNGFIGAMVFGDVNKERIQLNEKSLWSGSTDDNDNPDAAAYIEPIRSLLFAGKFSEATALTNKTQICLGKGSGQGNGAAVPFGCFQTLGDLWIDFNLKSPYKNYYRDLDLIRGIASVSYEQEGIKFSREIFADNPDRAIVIKLAANKANALSFTLSLDRPERFETSASAPALTMKGVMNNGKAGDGMRYTVKINAVLKGGTLQTKDNSLVITKATEVLLIITAATDYRLHYPDYIDKGYESKLDSITASAIKKPYASLLKNHTADFSGFMKRSDLYLGNEENARIPTDELMNKNAITGNELYLHALYYQYGRYLLLSSSRSGSLPANLQGIWANKIQTPWNGDYHTDINVQMNYWPAEVSNLSECHEQLIDLIESIEEPGKRTARIQYQLPGWVIHPITNVWGYTAPGEHPGWGMHVAAGAWLCQHIWEHFAFTRDTVFLKKVWPLLKSSCEFYMGWLVQDPATGKWVSGPATSPENAFKAPGGYEAQISMGPSHDQEVIHELFTHTLLAAEILQHENENDFIHKLDKIKSAMAMPLIAGDGRLMEWAKEYEEADPHHRHSSHLYALYPGNEISFYKSPSLAAAAKKSLEKRGDDGNGWSLAWKICFWARLHDGERALKLLNGLLKPVSTMETVYDRGGGSYLNLFDAGPPFQIDGNFGAVAGIAEMLLQSHEAFIELLPAVPHTWKKGRVTGLCARGGFVLSMVWDDSKITSAVLLSKKGGTCKIKYKEKQIELHTVAGASYDLKEFKK